MGGMVNSLRCHRRERRIVTVMSRSDFNMEAVVQLVSTPDCGSGGRGFEFHYPPHAQGIPFSGIPWLILWAVAKR